MKVKEMVVASLAALLAGCTCTTISDEYSAPDPDKSGALRYKKVADLDSRGNYSADVIPVVLRMKECQEKRDPISDLHGIAWLCTVGLFPMWDTYERTWEVEVKTPLGVKSGTCTKTRREYFGWVPYLLPAAASDSEMKSDPSGELARRVVAQFKSEWTPEKVAALNTAERNRIAAQRKRADELLTAKDWKAVIALCSNEKDERFADEYRRKVKEAEQQTLTDIGNALQSLLAKNEYEKAEKLLSTEYASWQQVAEHDVAAWEAFTNKIMKLKEQFRIASKRQHLEKLMEQEKFQEIIEEASAEGALFADLAAKAKTAIQDREAKAKAAAKKKAAEARAIAVKKELAQIIGNKATDSEGNMPTGEEIVRGNATSRGYSATQIHKLMELLKGYELTFQNGTVSTVHLSNNDVTAIIEFAAPGASFLKSRLRVNARFVNAAKTQLVEELDIGATVKQLKGRVGGDDEIILNEFLLNDAEVIIERSQSKDDAIDLSKITGADLVMENAKKKSGYSGAQLAKLSRHLSGRKLTFANGKIDTVIKNNRRGYVLATILFADPLTNRFFSVNAKIEDATMAKFVASLDKGTQVKQLTGQVQAIESWSWGFSLKNAEIIVEKQMAHQTEIDPEKITGKELVARMPKMTTAQKKKLKKQLDSRELTFENGIVRNVAKNDNDGNIIASISFTAPKSESTSSPNSLTVFARFSDGPTAKHVESLNRWAKVKYLKGRVCYEEDVSQIIIEGDEIVAEDSPLDISPIDLQNITGNDIVIVDFKKKSGQGYTNAQLQNLSKQLKGRELTFESGSSPIRSINIYSIRKNKDGTVTTKFSFDLPGAGQFLPFMVEAKFIDKEMIKLVEGLEERTAVKQLKGRVNYETKRFDYNDAASISRMHFKLIDASLTTR